MKSDGNIVEIRCLFMNQIQLNEGYSTVEWLLAEEASE